MCFEISFRRKIELFGCGPLLRCYFATLQAEGSSRSEAGIFAGAPSRKWLFSTGHSGVVRARAPSRALPGGLPKVVVFERPQWGSARAHARVSRGVAAPAEERQCSDRKRHNPGSVLERARLPESACFSPATVEWRARAFIVLFSFGSSFFPRYRRSGACFKLSLRSRNLFGRLFQPPRLRVLIQHIKIC